MVINLTIQCHSSFTFILFFFHIFSNFFARVVVFFCGSFFVSCVCYLLRDKICQFNVLLFFARSLFFLSSFSALSHVLFTFDAIKLLLLLHTSCLILFSFFYFLFSFLFDWKGRHKCVQFFFVSPVRAHGTAGVWKNPTPLYISNSPKRSANRIENPPWKEGRKETGRITRHRSASWRLGKWTSRCLTSLLRSISCIHTVFLFKLLIL